MARALRGAAAHLAADPAQFDLFQAIRLLEQLRPDLAPVGYDWPGAREAVRLGVKPTLAPPAGGVADYRPGDGPAALTASVGGLLGPGGALPDHYTALAVRQLRRKDATLRDFLDLFHHRLLSLHYRAWRRRSPALAAERPGRGGDDFRRALLAVAGFSGPSATPPRVPGVAPKLAGLFARRTRTAAGLEATCAAASGLPASVESLAGQWLYLDGESRCRLGSATPRRLGADAVLGRRVWDRQGGVRVTLGPVGRATLDALSRRGHARAALEVAARTYAGVELDLDVTIAVAPTGVPPAELRHPEHQRPRLGRDAWLFTHRPAGAVTDSGFRVGG